jgi:hypothetical protein
MQTLQAILTIIIGISVALIAYQQYVVNRNRLKLELFEKRFKVYIELMKVLARVLKNGNITPEELNTFGMCKSEGAFLFDREMGDYLELVFNNLNTIYANHLYMSQSPDTVSQKVRDEYFETVKWIIDEFANCKIRFDKFLQVDWH